MNRKKRLSDKNCTSIIHVKIAKYAKFCFPNDFADFARENVSSICRVYGLTLLSLLGVWEWSCASRDHEHKERNGQFYRRRRSRQKRGGLDEDGLMFEV